MANTIFDLLRPMIEDWNAHNSNKVALVLDDDLLTISPVNTARPYLPGVVVTNVALLSEVYGFCFTLHARNNAPYITI